MGNPRPPFQNQSSLRSVARSIGDPGNGAPDPQSHCTWTSACSECRFIICLACLFLFVLVFTFVFAYYICLNKVFFRTNHAFLFFIGGLGESTLLSWFKPLSGEGECYVSPQRDIFVLIKVTCIHYVQCMHVGCQSTNGRRKSLWLVSYIIIYITTFSLNKSLRTN
jgi:hypothetical protein